MQNVRLGEAMLGEVRYERVSTMVRVGHGRSGLL